MACTLITHGRGLDCNRVSGGIKNVYFAIFDTSVPTISALNVLTNVDMGTTKLYKYVMPRGVSSVTDTIVGSSENGTIYYTPTIQVIYNRLSAVDQNEIKLLGQTQLMIFVECNALLPNSTHNLVLCLGAQNGMVLNAGTETTGAAWGDRNGYDLTFDGMETFPMQTVVDYTTTIFDNLDNGAQIPIVYV